MSEITKKDVERIAGLARIKFSDKEKENMAEELGAILGYVDKLKEVDTEGVEPIAHITGLENVLRKDLPRDDVKSRGDHVALREVLRGEPKKKPLENQAADAAKLVEMAPEKKDNYIKVPAVFSE